MKKEDRRVRYTKGLLKSALVDMMKEKHISKISVKALCDEADVHRTTFYAYYEDVYDLLRRITDEALENISAYLDEQGYDDSPLSVQKLNKILQYVGQKAGEFRAILSDNGDVAIQRELISRINAVTLPIIPARDGKTKEYLNLFAVNGCLVVLSAWLQGGMRESSAEMSEFIIKVLHNGVWSF